MKYRAFECGALYCVAVYNGYLWMTFRFDDTESQSAFIVALGNISETLEDVTEKGWCV